MSRYGPTRRLLCPLGFTLHARGWRRLYGSSSPALVGTACRAHQGGPRGACRLGYDVARPGASGSLRQAPARPAWPGVAGQRRRTPAARPGRLSPIPWPTHHVAFDARSLTTQQTDGKGQVESRTYDALGRQTGTLYTNVKIVTTTFDLLGRKTAEANENGTWNRTYDALGQRLTEVGPGYPSGLPLTSVYDPAGNRTQLQTWRGSQSWSFDGLNRSRTLTDIEGGLYTWSYEARGYLNRLDYPNGVIFSVAYGSTGRPWQGSYSSAADAQVELVEYSAYDAVDNPTTMHQYWGGTHGNGRAMSYDAANQLTYWSDSDTEGPTAVFDPAGNPSSAKVGGFSYSYTYDAADELVNLTTVQPYDPAFTSATFSYDSNGNRSKEQFFQSFTSGPRTDYTTYTWDAANRLLAVNQTQSGAVDLANSYRPDGLRHQRSDTSGTTQILWDGDEPLAQVDTLGNLQRYWSRASAPATGSWRAHWSRLVKARLPGNPYPDQYLHADAQGTILAVSGSNGAALTHNQPPPRVWGMDGTLIAPFSWEGEHGYWYEGQLARPMHYVRARWFVDGGPGIGGAPGWLSPDPLRFGGGDWNLYRYARNRPTVRVDPSGLASDPPHRRCGKRIVFDLFIPEAISTYTPILPIPILGDNRGSPGYSFNDGGNFRGMQYAVLYPDGSYDPPGRIGGVSHLGPLTCEVDPSGMSTQVIPGFRAGYWTVIFSGTLSYGCLAKWMSPPVQWYVELDVTPDGAAVTSGQHTVYPNFEIWVYTDTSKPSQKYGYDHDSFVVPDIGDFPAKRVDINYGAVTITGQPGFDPNIPMPTNPAQ